MKNVFLIGDSIRFGATGSPGYGGYVKEKLKDVANVYAPDENCRFAQYTQRYLCNWKNITDAEKIDIVHWNNGLWDVLRLDGDDPFTSKDFYVQTLGGESKQEIKINRDSQPKRCGRYHWMFGNETHTIQFFKEL